jgi:hypothetical protein
MKRMACIWLAGAMLAGVAGALAGAQQSDSLGDYARSVRKERKQDATAKKFDNDNLPHNDKLSVVGNPSGSDQPAGGGATDTSSPSNGDNTADAGKTESKGDADKQKENNDWKDKITVQKGQVDLLTRELDVLQREYRIRAATFYADAGNRLRNAGDWDKEDTQYKQQIADKQKALDDAKQKLDDMQEEARKSGVPSSQRE